MAGKEVDTYEESLANFVIETMKTFDPTIVGLGLIEKGARFFEAKQKKRIYEFNQKLLIDEAAEYDKKRLRDGILSEDDYFSLLSAAINDDEEKKTTIYVTLYRNILADRLTGDKFKVLKILKSLTYSALQLIQKVYVYHTYEIQDSGSTKTLDRFLQELNQDNNVIFEVETLKQFGLLRDIDNPDSGRKLSSTDFCINVARLYFNDRELRPEAIGRKTWNQHVSFLSDISAQSMADVRTITTMLNQRNIKQTAHLDFRTNAANWTFTVQTIVILLGQGEPSAKALESLRKIPNKIIKVTLDNSIEDPIPSIGNKLIYLDLKNKDSKNYFLEQFEVPDMDKW